MAKGKPPENSEEPRQSDERPPLVVGPSTIMTPEAFARQMSLAVSPQFLNPERLALLKTMSQTLVREPALLEVIERMLADYSDEFVRVSPSQAELESFGFGWSDNERTAESDLVAIAPVAAAAALAPPAAAIAAAHTPSD